MITKSIDNLVHTFAKNVGHGVRFSSLVGLEDPLGNPLAIAIGCCYVRVLVAQVVKQGGMYCGNRRVIWHTGHSDKVSVEDDIPVGGKLCAGGVVVVGSYEGFERRRGNGGVDFGGMGVIAAVGGRGCVLVVGVSIAQDGLDRCGHVVVLDCTIPL